MWNILCTYIFKYTTLYIGMFFFFKFISMFLQNKHEKKLQKYSKIYTVNWFGLNDHFSFHVVPDSEYIIIITLEKFKVDMKFCIVIFIADILKTKNNF